MQYMLLIYEDERIYGGPEKNGPALQEMIAKHMAFAPGLGSARVGGAGLKGTAAATTVRAGNLSSNADERQRTRLCQHEAGGRMIAALAARFRNLDIAEEALADACAARGGGGLAERRHTTRHCSMALLRRAAPRSRSKGGTASMPVRGKNAKASRLEARMSRSLVCPVSHSRRKPVLLCL
jgi:hypothetical protein